MLNQRPRDEEGRLRALHDLRVVDTPPEEAFDRIARVARTVMQVPTALVSLIDRDRQWFKSHTGLDLTETPRQISFCHHTIEQDVPLIVEDAALDPRFCENPLVTGEPHIRFYIGAQLRDGNGFKLGTLCCIGPEPRTPSPEQVSVLQDLARLVVDEFEFRRLATIDSLTGTMTRRTFLESARSDFARARQYRRPLSCLMIDADFFKGVNDTYGHAAGDRVLQRIAHLCRWELRTSGYIGRLGGEEFAMLLPDMHGHAALTFAERVRTLVRQESFESARGTFQVTLSLGIAALTADTADVDELLERADAALYRAKAAGRDCSSVDSPASLLSLAS